MGYICESINKILENKNSDKYIIELIKERLKKCNFKLYKYCSIDKDFYFNNLENDILYFNSIDSFNDPFESTLTCSDFVINYSLLNTINNIPQSKKLLSQISLLTAKTLIKNSNLNETALKNKLAEELLVFLKNDSNGTILEPTINDTKQLVELVGDKNLSTGNFESLLHKFSVKTQRKIDLKPYHIAVSDIKQNTPKSIKNTLSSNYKLTCFSEKPNDILMWSHYANKHQGFVVEYNFSEIFNDEELIKQNLEVLLLLFKIEYINKVPVVPISLLQNNNKIEDYLGDVLEMIYQKNKCWKYEKEWRSVIRRDNNCEIKFIKPSKVIAGVNSSDETMRKLKIICTKRGIKLKKYKTMHADLY